MIIQVIIRLTLYIDQAISRSDEEILRIDKHAIDNTVSRLTPDKFPNS